MTTTNVSEGHWGRPWGPHAYQDTGSQLIITVANPNTPGSDDSNPENRIIIDKHANTYYFDFNGNGLNPWTGGNFSGGVCSRCALSAPPPPTPPPLLPVFCR